MQPLIDTIRRTKCLDRICVGSCSDKRLRHIRSELGAGLCTSMGSSRSCTPRAGKWNGVTNQPISTRTHCSGTCSPGAHPYSHAYKHC
jgi:hypothetical protein